MKGFPQVSMFRPGDSNEWNLEMKVTVKIQIKVITRSLCYLWKMLQAIDAEIHLPLDPQLQTPVTP